MKSTKFILAHILVDVFFVVAIAYIFLVGMQGSIQIRDLIGNGFTVFVIILAVLQMKENPSLEVVGTAAFTILLGKWYVRATENSYDILAADVWYMNLVRGIFLIIVFYGILDLIKYYLGSFLKCAHIYYLANSEKDYSILDSFFRACLKFKFTLAIPIFNSVIRKCASEIFDVVSTQSTDGDAASSQVDEMFMKLSETKIGKASKWFVKKYIDYVDECVLAYCYAHSDKSLAKATVEALSIFLFNSVQIIPQMGVVIIIQVLLRIAVLVIAVLILFNYSGWTLTKIIVGFIALKIIEFIIQDALLEPLMLNRILCTFMKYQPEQDYSTYLFDKFPILQKIKKLQNSSEPDDLDDTTAKVDTEIAANNDENSSNVESAQSEIAPNTVEPAVEQQTPKVHETKVEPTVKQNVKNDNTNTTEQRAASEDLIDDIFTNYRKPKEEGVDVFERAAKGFGKETLL